MPECDAVFFASVSAVESFAEQFGVENLNEKEIVVIGKHWPLMPFGVR